MSMEMMSGRAILKMSFDRHCPHFVFFWHGIDGHDDLRKSIFAQIADLTYSILLLNEKVNEREKGSRLTFVWIG